MCTGLNGGGGGSASIGNGVGDCIGKGCIAGKDGKVARILAAETITGIGMLCAGVDEGLPATDSDSLLGPTLASPLLVDKFVVAWNWRLRDACNVVAIELWCPSHCTTCRGHGLQ